MILAADPAVAPADFERVLRRAGGEIRRVVRFHAESFDWLAERRGDPHPGPTNSEQERAMATLMLAEQSCSATSTPTSGGSCTPPCAACSKSSRRGSATAATRASGARGRMSVTDEAAVALAEARQRLLRALGIFPTLPPVPRVLRQAARGHR